MEYIYSIYIFINWKSSNLVSCTYHLHYCTGKQNYLLSNILLTLCRMITWVVFLRMFWNFISSLPRGGSLSFLVGTISKVLVMEIGWRDVGSGGLYTSLSRSINKHDHHRQFLFLTARFSKKSLWAYVGEITKMSLKFELSEKNRTQCFQWFAIKHRQNTDIYN
jgi:hypothetical protein